MVVGTDNGDVRIYNTMLGFVKLGEVCFSKKNDKYEKRYKSQRDTVEERIKLVKQSREKLKKSSELGAIALIEGDVEEDVPKVTSLPALPMISNPSS